MKDTFSMMLAVGLGATFGYLLGEWLTLDPYWGEYNSFHLQIVRFAAAALGAAVAIATRTAVIRMSDRKVTKRLRAQQGPSAGGARCYGPSSR